MTIANCYWLQLDCDAPMHAKQPYEVLQRRGSQTFSARNTEAKALRDARKAGWRVDMEERVAVCPECIATIQTELCEIATEIDKQYWTFTRTARGKPVDPKLHRRRAELEPLLGIHVHTPSKRERAAHAKGKAP